jgi:nitrogen fixation/metabolism regulation signal transduction histidine kinase
VRIGPRLTLAFTLVAVCLLVGMLAAFQQLAVAQAQAQRLYATDERLLTVLRVRNDILAFEGKLRTAIALRDVRRLESAAAPVRQTLIADVALASDALRSTVQELPQHALLLSALETIRSSLPAQVEAMVEMARAGDWPAARLRFDNQVRTFGDDLGTLAEGLDVAATRERAGIMDSIRQLQRRAFWTLLAVAAAVLLAAAGLGYAVTRSIARPLSDLDAAALALSRGEFDYVVRVTGSDELASLGRVFNDTAAKLRELYVALERKKDAALEQVKVLSGLLPICSACKRVRNDSGYWEQIEVYVHAHSEADFSHGVCPECIQKLYPEYARQLVKEPPA